VTIPRSDISVRNLAINTKKSAADKLMIMSFDARASIPLAVLCPDISPSSLDIIKLGL
jgi:hypothetical protein